MSITVSRDVKREARSATKRAGMIEEGKPVWTRCGPSCVCQHLQKSNMNPTVSCVCSVKTAMQQIGKLWTRFPMAVLVKGLNECEPQRWSFHSMRRLATSAMEKRVQSFSGSLSAAQRQWGVPCVQPRKAFLGHHLESSRRLTAVHIQILLAAHRESNWAHCRFGSHVTHTGV
jgi:hypothetical protein